MSANYYSQTPNFVSASSEDVDPRTRLFSFQYTLGQLIGNNAMGPELNFTLNYSPTSATDYYDFGIGVTPALTIYDATNGQLLLASGESYRVDGSASPPIVQQNKMRTFDFASMVTSEGRYGYRVTENDGTVTDLMEYDAGIYVTTRIYTALGYSLIVDWETIELWGWGISSISDDSGVTLLKIDHDAGPMLTFYPGSSEEYSITLGKGNGYLSTISHSGLPGRAWHYYYQDVGMGGGLQTLTQTVAITGLKKTVIYNSGTTNGLMLFPDQSGQGALPAVTELSVDPGFNQPVMVTTYTPDTPQGFPNYLGYDAPQGGQWDASTDYVYSLAGQDYSYSTTLTQTDSDGQLITTTYTYNNYHLLTRLEVQQGKTTYTVDTWYYADWCQSVDPNATYDDLPAQYQYPLSQTLTWSDDSGTRSEVTQYIYDGFGNLTQQIDPDGTQTDYEFYSSEGEVDSDDGYTGCPRDPNDFANLMKSKKVTPAPSDYDDVPVRATYYHYSPFEALDDRPMVTAIVKDKETLVKLIDNGTNPPDKQPLTTLDTQYYSDNKTSFKYGYPIYKGTTVFYHDSEDDHPHLIKQEYDYDAKNNVIQSQLTLTSCDGIKLNGVMVRSCYSGRIISLTDIKGTPHTYYYDAAGRFSYMHTYEGNADYERSMSVDYSYEADGSENTTAISTTIINNDGSISRLNYDSMGRVISIEKSATDQLGEEFSTVLSRRYDTLGRIEYETIADSYFDNTHTKQTAEVNIKTQYDSWGRPCAHNFLSGRECVDTNVYLSKIVEFSSVENSYSSYLQSAAGKISSNYKVVINNQDLPESVITFDAEGNEYSRTYTYYDGLKRVRQSVDQVGNPIIYEYDDFDRAYKITYSDGTIVTQEYAAQFSHPLVTTITVTDVEGKDYVIGSREFDGLGRIQNSTVGGRYESYTYNDNTPDAHTFTDSVNRVFTYGYDPLLENALISITAEYNGQSTEQNYSYFKHRGLLDTATEAGQKTHAYRWLSSGKISTETITNSLGSKSPSYTWSVMNNPVSYTDIDGNQQWISYYLSGKDAIKPQGMSDPAVTLNFTYDDFGRLYTQTAHSVSQSEDEVATLEIELVYDDYGREHIRTITPDSGEKITITTNYYENNQVSHVKIEQGAELLSDNSYYYDLRNRLHRHDCSGSSLPKDGYGQPFTSQVFVYDSLNNIQTCTTQNSSSATDTATFNYENSRDPTQLTSIMHEGNSAYPPVINLSYYDDGRLEYDEAGRLLTYDASGRLFSVVTTDGAQATYGYDALHTLVYQAINTDEQYLYYRGSQLINQIRESENQQDRIIPGLTGNAAVNHG